MQYRARTVTLLAVFTLLLAHSAATQIFKVQAGSSTMVNADGGSVEFLSPNYQGSFGLGYLENHFGVGGNLRSKYRDYTVVVGDQSVPFTLPTDLFNPSQYFMARGMGVLRTTDQDNLFAMVGMTSVGLGTGFFQIAQSENRVAVLFLEHRLKHNLRLYSRNIFSNRQTSLQSLRWDAMKWLTASATGGAGSNQHYVATGVDLHTSDFAAKASYVGAGAAFRRVIVSTPLFSEVNHENVEIAYQPFHAVGVTVGHQNLVEELTPGGPFATASVNQIAANFTAGRVHFGTGWFSSQYSGRTTTGLNLYAGRTIRSRVELTGNYFQSQLQGVSLKTISGTFRELFSQHFSLLQVVSHSNGQMTFAYGGEFLANRFKVSADYQNVYLPFRPSRPFEQALALDASVRVIGAFQLIAANNVGPDGHIRYTFGASTFLYRERGLAGHSRDALSYNFPKYAVEGTVRLADGLPFEGAAVHVGQELAYTDDTGHFQVRLRRSNSQPLNVAIQEFLVPGSFEVVEAPTSVQPEPESHPTQISILIRRVPNNAAKSPTQSPGSAQMQ